MLIREGEMAESNNKPVCRQLLTCVRPESDSSSEEEEIPQFHKGILKQIEKIKQMLKKCEEKEQVGEKEDSNQISGNGEDDEFDYEKWVEEQCKKIKEIEEGEFDEKTMEAMVEESDLSLVSLARPAIELKRFKCKVSAQLRQGPVRTRPTKFVCLYQNCDKNCLSQIFNLVTIGALENSKIFVDHKVSITWRNQR